MFEAKRSAYQFAASLKWCGPVSLTSFKTAFCLLYLKSFLAHLLKTFLAQSTKPFATRCSSVKSYLERQWIVKWSDKYLAEERCSSAWEASLGFGRSGWIFIFFLFCSRLPKEAWACYLTSLCSSWKCCGYGLWSDWWQQQEGIKRKTGASSIVCFF